jgi:hypothetical protein
VGLLYQILEKQIQIKTSWRTAPKPPILGAMIVFLAPQNWDGGAVRQSLLYLFLIDLVLVRNGGLCWCSCGFNRQANLWILLNPRSLEIEDDINELIVFVGNFTHWHAGCYDERLSEEEKAIEIAEAVVDFLRDVVNDQIVLGRSPEGGGGFDRLESLQRPFNPHQKWLWSGPIGHHLLP